MNKKIQINNEEKKKDIDTLRAEALGILSPIKPVDNTTIARGDFLLSATRSIASDRLPSYYFVYFLFRELLDFENLGHFEKIAWSFPIDYKGRAFLIEYRKSGVGIFIQGGTEDEQQAMEICQRINRTVSKVKIFYDYLAEKGIQDSKLNITNNCADLFARFQYLIEMYREHQLKVKEIKGVFDPSRGISKATFDSFHIEESYKAQRKKNWMAISGIEAFFSWTEHLFIHLGILGGRLLAGNDIARLIGAEWKDKFAIGLTLNEPENVIYLNKLLVVRQQLRNFVAHGAFGKDGAAFNFHSGTGAVPVVVNAKKDRNRFSLTSELTFDDDVVIDLLENFVDFLKTGKTACAMYHIMECGVPTILTYARDGTYMKCSEDIEKMKKFSEYLLAKFNAAANMEF